MPTPIAVSIPDAVQASGVSRTKIYEALKRGDLKGFKVGSRTLIYYDSLQAHLASLPAYQAGA